MFSGLSSLGQFHTIVSELAIVFGLVALARDGKIDLATRVGKAYIGSMLIGSLTAFGLFKHGFGPGHVLSLVTLVVSAFAVLAPRFRWLGQRAEFARTAALSTSFLLLMVFATTETLTRLPAGHPIAADQNAPVLGAVRLGLLAVFVVGLRLQWRRKAVTAA